MEGSSGSPGPTTSKSQVSLHVLQSLTVICHRYDVCCSKFGGFELQSIERFPFQNAYFDQRETFENIQDISQRKGPAGCFFC